MKPTARENALVQCWRWGMLSLDSLWNKLGPVRAAAVFAWLDLKQPERHILIRSVEGCSETLADGPDVPEVVAANPADYGRSQAFDPSHGWIYIYSRRTVT